MNPIIQRQLGNVRALCKQYRVKSGIVCQIEKNDSLQLQSQLRDDSLKVLSVHCVLSACYVLQKYGLLSFFQTSFAHNTSMQRICYTPLQLFFSFLCIVRKNHYIRPLNRQVFRQRKQIGLFSYIIYIIRCVP
jgi:hypothetical protein